MPQTSTSSYQRLIIILCGTAGVAITGAALVRYLRSWLRRAASSNLEQNIENAISNEMLADLAKSSNVGLRQSAEQMLLDRITKGDAFLHVLASCRSSDEETALKACTALCVILKSVDQRVFRVEIIILQTLVSSLSHSMSRERYYQTHMPDIDFPERMQRMTLATIYDLSSDPAFLGKLEQLEGGDIASIILKLLQCSRNKEVHRYSLLLLLQMTMQGKNCASLDAFGIIAKKCVSNHGDSMLQKICFQLLVTLINAQSADTTLYINEIAKQNILVPMVVSCKSQDVEIAFWSVALLHEFAVHNVCRKELCSLPYLIKNLQSTLMASEAGVQRLILRVLAFLALRNDSLKNELLKNKAVIGHLPTCLASGNRDVVHWALVLVHDLAMMGRHALETLLEATDDTLIRSLLSLSASRDNVMLRLLAETLGLFCGCEHLHYRLVRAGSLEMILGLAQSHDPDLVFWSSALLLNLAMTADSVKAEILSSGGLRTLIDLSLGDHDNSQVTTMAAKTLVMMAVLDEPIHLHVKCETDSASVEVNKKLLPLKHTGVSIVLWETLLDKKLQVWHFTPSEGGESPDTSGLVSIPILEQQSSRTCQCNVVIFTINGVHAPVCLRALGTHLQFDDYSQSGITTSDPLELANGQSCCIVAMVTEDCKLDVMQITKGQSDIKLQLSGAEVVKQRIRQLILRPLLHRIVGVPANSPINRVSDLELLEVLVRHEAQKDLVLECQTAIDQLTAMVFYLAHKGVDQLRSEPLAVAHAHGALRVIRVLAMYDHYRSVLLTADTVPAVVKLLNGLVSFWLNSILSSQGQGRSRPASRLSSRPASRAGFRPGESADINRDELDFGMTVDSVARMEHNIAQAVSAISNTVQQLATMQPQPLPHNRRLRSSSDTISTATDSNLAAEVEDGDDKCEEGQMTNHLAKFAILTMAHLLNTQDDDMSRAVQSSLHLSGAMHALWATLLCSSEQLQSALALPAVVAMTKLAATELPLSADDVVKLDIRTRTPALLVSSDHMEIRNDSWTFESIRSIHHLPVERTQGCTEGWYYEIELKSNGIIQVGWATEQCEFGPEKGVGVGDDLNSCAFDGARCRKWNGPITETLSNEYGLEWQVGDIVSCLMDRHGNASFWLRGVNMGVAFQDLDLSLKWYPACSLSTDQQVKINFGDSQFRYGDVIPASYIPFCQAHLKITSPEILHERQTLQHHNLLENLDQEENSNSQSLPLQRQSGDSEMCSALSDYGTQNVTPELMYLQEATMADGVVYDEQDLSDEGPALAVSDFGYRDMGGEGFADMTDSPSHVAMAKIAEIDATLQRESNPLSRNALGLPVTMGYEPIRSHVFGSGDQGAPIGITGVMDAEGGGEADEFQPPPSLFFEVNLTHLDKRPVVMGFCNADASIQVCAVLTEDHHLIMPDNSLEKVSGSSKVTVGCAVLNPPGVVFFTVNGQPIKRLFNFLHDDQPMQPLTPCTNSPYLKVNFGQTSFLYEPANEFEQRIYMAALLHDYCQQTITG